MIKDDKYKYYWDMKKRKEQNKPLNWDKIITYMVVYPSLLLFAICFILAKGAAGLISGGV